MPTPKSTLALALGLFAFLPIAAPALASREINAVAATVNGRVITEAEVRLMMLPAQQMLRAEFSGPELEKRLRESRERILQDLIDREIILTEFESRGGHLNEDYVDQEIERVVRIDHRGDREAFLRQLASAGITNRKYRELTRKRLIVQILRSQVTRDLPPPRPDEVRREYEEMARRIGEEGGSIQFSKIFIPRVSATATPEEQKELAVEIRTQLLQGADFASMAEQYSRDARAGQGGEWPMMERRFLRREIADAAFATPIGQLSPLVEDDSGWHIIRPEEKTTGRIPSFDEMREEAIRRVDLRQRAEAYEKWIETLREKAVINRF